MYLTEPQTNDQQIMECNDENQIPVIARKCVMDEHEKKIQVLSRDNEVKSKECDEAWMRLKDSNQTVKSLQDKHETQKELWVSSMRIFNTKIQELKSDYLKLSDEAKDHANFIHDFSGIASAMHALSVECGELKKKYIDESTERKRLYNELLELKGNIRVFCRCRPLNAEEIAAGASSVVEFDESKDNELCINANGAPKKVFKFDQVFTPQDDQDDVFASTAPFVTSVLDGYNVCIFAYGQTGTGKTFTMEGTPENRGVNYRTLDELFRVADERKGQCKYDISVSVLEVYNEQIRDLLASPVEQGQTAKKLEIKQVAEGVHHVPGLVEAQVHNMNEVWEVLQSGSRSRAVGSTNANELSSRSHCMLSVMVRGQSLINGNCTRSKLWLVDLAGSERVAKTDVHGDRLKEAQCINKSLSALGDVISALTMKNSHIPYRNSKLTHLLQDSLGGDSKTLMFVQISPSESDMGETLCSLNFASRVRGIELGPARKQHDAGEFFKYKQMVEKIRKDGKESKKMEESLQNLEIKFKGREQMCRHLQEKIKELEGQLANEKKARFQCETKLKEQQRQLEKVSEKQSVFSQLNNLRTINERAPLSKDLTNLTTSLTENKQRLSLQCNGRQQEDESLMKMGMTDSFPKGSLVQKENIRESTYMSRDPLARPSRSSISTAARRTSVIPVAGNFPMTTQPISNNAMFEYSATLQLPNKNARISRRTSTNTLPQRTSVVSTSRRTSINTLPQRTSVVSTSRRTSINTLPRRASIVPSARRTSMGVLPARRDDVSGSAFRLPGHKLASTSMEENKYGKTPCFSTPVSLRGLKNSNTLSRFRRSIHGKVHLSSPFLKVSNALQEINEMGETQSTDTNDNATVPAASSSWEQRLPLIDTNRCRRLSTTKAWGSLSSSGNLGAQRVLSGKGIWRGKELGGGG